MKRDYDTMSQLIDVAGNPAGCTIEEPDLDSLKLHLVTLAGIFLEYGMHEDWAIGYLHYEFKIDPSLVMVHKQISASKYCIPIELATLNMAQLKPHTYQLHNGTLQPLEFELLPALQLPRAAPTSEFLTRLAETLQAIPGGHRLILCPSESQTMASFFLRPEDCGGAGGFCVSPLDPSATVIPGTAWVETQWNFDWTGDIPMPNLATVIDERQPLLQYAMDEELAGAYWPLKIRVQQKCLVKVD